MKSFNCLFINAMARSKINKRSKPHDPKKARCDRRLWWFLVCGGGFLSVEEERVMEEEVKEVKEFWFSN